MILRQSQPTIFKDLNIDYDLINLYRSSKEYEPLYSSYGFQLMINSYDKIFMLCDQSINEDAGIYILESVSQPFQRFLSQNKKLFISADFPNSLSETSSAFDYLPIDSLAITQLDKTIRISNGGKVKPIVADYSDTLISDVLINGANPIIIKNGAEAIYSAELELVANDSISTNTIAARNKNGLGNTNMVLFSLELSLLNNDANALKNLINKVINDEFNW